jgi:serine/threonine protein kinase
MSGSFVVLQDPDARFDVLEELGAGSYGRVFRARDKKNGQTVAIKAMSCDADNDGIIIDRDMMEKEVDLMRNLSKNEFIVTYHDAFNCVKLREFWISMELCEIGSCLVRAHSSCGRHSCFFANFFVKGFDSCSSRSVSRSCGAVYYARLHAGPVVSAPPESCTSRSEGVSAFLWASFIV